MINMTYAFSDCTHGTTLICLNNIQTAGFQVSSGVRGAGVYFWYDQSHGFNLAVAWVRKKCSEENNCPADKRGVVIFTDLSANDDEYLSLADEDFVEQFVPWATKKGYNLMKREDICTAYSVFITAYEQQNSCNVKVLRCRVSPPARQFFDRYREYPSLALGDPTCLVVRDVGMINIKKTPGFRI